MVRKKSFETFRLGILGLGAVLASGLIHGSRATWASTPGSRLPAPRTLSPRDELQKDQQLSDRMTELGMSPEAAPDFDGDLARLSSRERQYRERLPGVSGHPRLKSVVTRVAARPYQPSRR